MRWLLCEWRSEGVGVVQSSVRKGALAFGSNSIRNCGSGWLAMCSSRTYRLLMQKD